MAVMKAAAPSFSRRAWRRLQLAVLWARKSGAFRRGLVDVHHLRLAPGFFKNWRSAISIVGGGRNDHLHYGEREFSIEETPVFRFKTPSARVLRMIPCITPATDGFDNDDDDAYFFRPSRLDCYAEPSECDEESYGDGDPESAMEASCTDLDAERDGEDVGVDVKAEEFIAKFHAQMRLQRQISWLQYNEMMERSLS